MAIHKKKNNLWLIDLDQNLDGFRQFISCWVYKDDEKVFLVDPGPASTIPLLKGALKQLSIKSIDYILLTHIHIDHAGGTGLLLDDFQDAKVICHPRGIPHMIDPQKLWEGSLSVLGIIAEIYGPIAAIPEINIMYSGNILFNNSNIKVYETPGHAAHHINYLFDGILFAGEVAGVISPSAEFYLRIATPPKFIYEVYKESLFKAASLKCDVICFGHYGLSEDTNLVFDSAKNQLELWMKIIKEKLSKNNNVSPEEIFEILLKEDALLKSYLKMPKDIQNREKYFSTNSVKGIMGYLKS